MKKLLALTICVIMIMCCLTAQVSAAVETVFGYPAELMGSAVLNAETGYVETASNGTSNSGATFWFMPDQSVVTGDVYIEYTLAADTSQWSDTGSTLVAFKTLGDGATIELRWWKNRPDSEAESKIEFVGVKPDGEDGKYMPYEISNSLSYISVKTKYSYSTGKHTVWINDELLYEDKDIRSTENGTGLQKAQIWTNAANTAYRITDFKWYPADDEGEEETKSVMGTVYENSSCNIYATDFSEDELDSLYIEAGDGVELDSENQILSATGTLAADATFAKIVAARDGIKDPVTYEFDLDRGTLYNVSDSQIRIVPQSKTDGWYIDLRLKNAKTPFVEINNAAGNSKTVECSTQVSHFKIRLLPKEGKTAIWVNGEQLVSEDESPDYIRIPSGFTDVAYLKIATTGKVAQGINLDNVKVYKDVAEGMPYIWETIAYDDFETAEKTPVADNGRIDILDVSGVSYNLQDGCLWLYTGSHSEIVKSFTYDLTVDGEPMTEENVVEFTMKNSNSSSGLFRVWLSPKVYVAWNPAMGIHLDYWDPDRSDTRYSAEDFNAQSELKVTTYLNPETHQVKIWFNNILALDHVFTDPDCLVAAAPSGMDFYTINGNLRIGEIRYYKPLKGLKVINEGNNIKIASDTDLQDCLLFFAKQGEGKLDDIVVSPVLCIKAGYNYTVDKTDWAGAKAYFWNMTANPYTGVTEIE